MKKYRYPGAPPFSYEDRKVFYGRDDDINRFFKYVNFEELVVLFSRSGLGKSSMLNAGIVPKLHAESNFQPFSVKFSSFGEEVSTSPVDILINEIKQSKDRKTFLDKIIKPDDSLWYHLKSHQIETKGTKDYFLIFDQFENLFSFPLKGERIFGQQLSDLLNVTIPQKYRKALEEKLSENPEFLSNEELSQLYKPFKVHIVIAIRSDKMALLNRLKISLPTILSKTFMLEALDRSQAEDAITYPAYVKDEEFFSPPFDYSDDALDEILKYLAKGGEQKIESFQLQILCQYIEENIVIGKKKKLVEADDLGDISAIFRNYYDNIIEKLPKDDQRNARILIEEGLIFEEDMRRLNLFEGLIFKTYEISRETLQELVNKRLLRAEPNVSGGFSYELSHDTLVGPILKAKAKRVKAEEEEAAKLEEIKIREKEKQEEKKRRRKMRLVGLLISVFLILAVGWLIHSRININKIKKQKATLETQQDSLSSLSITLQKNIAKIKRSDSITRERNERLRISDNTTKKLYEKEAEISHALSEQIKLAQSLQKEAQDNYEIAESRFEELQTRIGTQLMEKAGREAKVKHHNAAKLYALHAAVVMEFLSDANKDLSNEYATGQEFPLITATPEYTQKLQYIDFSPDGKTIATTGIGGQTITLWNLNETNLIEIATLTGPSSELNSLGFSPDGSSVAAGTTSGEIFIWNIKSNKVKQTLSIPGKEITALRFDPSGNYLVSAQNGFKKNSIAIWSVDKYNLLDSITGGMNSFNSLTFSRDGKYLAFAELDNTIKIYDINKQKSIKTLKGHSDKVRCLSFNSDNTLLASGSNDNNIVIWDIANIETARALGTLEGHEGNVVSIQFGNYDNLMAAGDENNSIRLWRIDPLLFKEQKDLSGMGIEIDRASNASEKMLLATLKNHLNPVVSVIFLEEGTKLASFGHKERSIKIWDLKTNYILAANIDAEKSIEDRISEAENRFNLSMVGSELVINRPGIDSLYKAAEYSYDYLEQARIYQQILKKYPNEIDAISGLAFASLINGDNESAIKHYNNYLAIKQHDYLAWNYLGNAYFRSRNWDSAIICYDKSIEIVPDYEYSWSNKGMALFELGMSDEAIISYKKVLEINPNTPDIYGHIGNYYYQNAKYDEAIRNYLKEVEINPYNTVGWYNLGLSYFYNNDTANSIISYQTAIETDPLYVNAYADLGYIYNLQKKYKDSYRMFIKVLEIDPLNANSWFYLGFLTINGDASKAIDHLFIAKELNEGYNQTDYYWNALGLAYFKNADYGNAEKYFKKAIDLYDSSAIYYQNIAMSLSFFKGKNSDEATSYYLKSIELSTRADMNEVDYDVRGFSYLATYDLNSAYQDLKTAKNLKPDNDKVYRSWACYYALKNQPEKALDNLTKLIELGFNDYHWIEHEPTLNNIRHDDRFKSIVEQMKGIKKDIEIWQNNIFQKYQLVSTANENFSKGNYQDAFISYRNVIKLYPDDEEFIINYAEKLDLMAYDSFDNMNYDAAYLFFIEMLNINPDYYSAEDWSDLAYEFYSYGSYENSEKLYQIAIQFDDKNTVILSDLATNYWVMGDTSASIATFKKILDIAPENEFALSSLVFIYSNPNNYDSIVYYTESYLQYYPDNASDWGNLGWYYIFTGDYRKSLDVSNKAYVMDNSLSWVLTNKGHALLLLGKLEESKDVYLDIKDNDWDGFLLKDAILQDFDAFEKAGIRNEHFDEIRALLNQ